MVPIAASAEDWAGSLSEIVGPRLSVRPIDRQAYARDCLPRAMLALGDGDSGANPPDVVVWPESADEVARIIRWAAQHGVPLVPYGGGSGVCGAAIPVRGGVILDLKRMNRVLSIDRDALEATFESGINGEHLEHELERQGLTLGHFPSSIMCSTLGGWLATRSAGQLSSKYGKIEDMVLSVDVVTGTGDRCTAGRAPRGAPGPDWTQLFVGSEGTLGVITQSTLRVRPAPETRLLRGWEFPRLEGACEAMRRIMQSGVRPAVIRLYDELDSWLHRSSSHAKETAQSRRQEAANRFAAPTDLEVRLRKARAWALRSALSHPQVLARALGLAGPAIGARCLLILGFEGDAVLTQAEAEVASRELAEAGGRDLGEDPGLHWFENRYKVSFQMSKIFENGAFVDTLEVATTWDRLLELYHAVRAALSRDALVMAHFSHAYVEGCSIYFTFVSAGRDRAEAERRYDALWRTGLHAALAAGGTLSHHHGVGLLKQRFMADELGVGLDLLRALKQVLDPAGILNPGKLGLEASA